MKAKIEETEIVNEVSESYALVQDQAPVEGAGFSADDIDIPKLNVLQKMSQITGPTGSIIIDQKHVIAAPEQKLSVIVLSATKKWKEDLPYDSDIMPKFANNQQAADALAATSEHAILEFAEIRMLIQEYPDCNDEAFIYPIGDKNYAIGRITVQKDAYRCTFKRLATFQAFNPKIQLCTKLWALSTELMTKGKYSWYVPTLSITKEDSPVEAVEFATRSAQ